MVDNMGLLNILQTIIMGQASWFVAALIVAEVLLSLLLWKTHEKEMYI